MSGTAWHNPVTGTKAFPRAQGLPTAISTFRAFDRNGDGAVTGAEVRRTSIADTNADGTVSQGEFLQARKAEARDARDTRVEQMIAGLSGGTLQKKLDKFDADKNGKLTVGEVLDGRRETRTEQRTEHTNLMYASLSGKNGISVKDHSAYAAYDANSDGSVSKKEFRTGQTGDWNTVRDSRLLNGKLGADTRQRLGLNALGKMRDASAYSTLDVGNLKNLSYDRVCDLIKAQGGKLFENGQPSILAVRTDNAGTVNYEDKFIVVKPNGQMRSFAGTTRPTVTYDNNGFSPDMVVTGNYKISPRPADGKWSDAFYIERQNGDMAVPTAKDRNGDGRYSASEIANPVLDDEIRLHPGNATTTSSAGCFNVQDYSDFLQFIGGHGHAYNMTLVNG